MEYKVLICDDEPLEREVLALIIERSGLPFKTVGEAKNGFEAVEKAEELNPDVVLMDIKMPGKDGLAASAEIKNLLPNTKIIIITAYDELEFVKEALKIGSVDYLLKPIRPEEFTAVLKKLMGLFEREKSSIKKEEELKIALKKAEKMIKAGILASLIMGDVKTEEELNVLKMQARLLDISALPNAILYVEPNLDESQPMAELLRYEVLNAVKDAVEEADDAFLMNLGEAVIIGANSEKVDILELSSAIQRKVEERTDILVTVGIAENREGYVNRKVYEEAKSNAHLGSFFLGGKIVTGEEMEELFKYGEEMDGDKEEKLLDCVALANYGEAEKVFEEILQNLVIKTRGSLLQCQTRLAEIMLLIWRRVRQLGWIDGRNSHLYFSYLKKLSRAQTLSALTMCGKSFLNDILLLSDNLKESKGLVDQVVKYINENYHKDLKLKEITRMIYINTEHFSRLFKKEVGCTYAEYLTRVRIESAKKYLSNPSFSVADVAKKVGYQDPNYFSKVFKKVVGITPTEYRKNIGIAVEGE